jgi:hypothetical protein
LATINVQGSAFASTSLQGDVAENEAQWQVAANAAFSTTLFDTWFQDTYVTDYTFTVTGVKRVWARVRYRDNYGVVGDWSAALLIVLATKVGRKAKGVSVVMPEPLTGYHYDNEAQFRKTVERAFQDTQQLILQQGRSRNYAEWKNVDTLADDGEITLPFNSAQIAGWVRVSVWGEAGGVSEGGMWVFGGNGGDAVVTKVSGTTNTAATDSDTDLCVYTDGSDIYLKNRLGESVDAIIETAWR